MTSIAFVTNINYNIQIKNITFIKNYAEQLIESIHKTIVNKLFNVAHSKIQTHQLTSKIYQIVSSFKIVLKLIRDVVISRFIAAFDPSLIFQNFSNLVHQICFEVLIYYDSTNKAILINIEPTYLLFVFVLRAHFFQLLLIASFFIHFLDRQQSRLLT